MLMQRDLTGDSEIYFQLRNIGNLGWYLVLLGTTVYQSILFFASHWGWSTQPGGSRNTRSPGFKLLSTRWPPVNTEKPFSNIEQWTYLTRKLQNADTFSGLTLNLNYNLATSSLIAYESSILHYYFNREFYFYLWFFF